MQDQVDQETDVDDIDLLAKRLSHYMQKANWKSMRSLSLESGCGESFVRDIINKKHRNPRLDKLKRVAQTLSVPVTYLTHGRPTVPIVGYVGAGAEVLFVDDAGSEFGLEEVEAPPGASPETVAVVVRGSSQYPKYEDGDIILYRRKITAGEAVTLGKSGREVVVRLPDGRTYLKSVRQGPNNLYDLHSWNAPPIEGIAIEWCAPIWCVLKDG